MKKKEEGRPSHAFYDPKRDEIYISSIRGFAWLITVERTHTDYPLFRQYHHKETKISLFDLVYLGEV